MIRALAVSSACVARAFASWVLSSESCCAESAPPSEAAPTRNKPFCVR